MATKKSDPQQPTLTPQQGIEVLEKQIQSGKQLLGKRPLADNDYGSWKLLTRNFLAGAFGANSPNVDSVMSVGNYSSFPMNAGPDYWENHRAQSLETQLSMLRGLVELLTTQIKLDDKGVAEVKAASIHGHRIFLVHGHDERALHEIARFLERLDQDVIVLREQPSRGQTIIEKFEEYSDVGFAVILLTPDDRGGTATTAYETQKPRARQNVIFEMGYFIGRLGRNRVCTLYRSGVEIPSDYSGVLYQELDEKGAWRLELAKELRAAGLNVDMNKAL